MSIPIDIDRLGAALSDFGPGYLLTVSDGTAVKVVTVEPRLSGGVLLVDGPGRGTLANLAGNPAVTLAFPPREEKGFTLLVDGTAVADEGTGQVRVTPTSAVLHRPAAHADGPPPPAGAPTSPTSPTGCGDDCHPIG